LYFKG